MNSANTMALFGNVLPIVSLMVSQVMRLVPQFVARGRGIAAAQDAVSAAAPQTKRQQTAGRLRIVSVLMGWGMEDGIERSDAMRAQGLTAARAARPTSATVSGAPLRQFSPRSSCSPPSPARARRRSA